MVWTYATLADLDRHEQPPYVLDTLIDPVRSVAEADVSVVVKQIADGRVGGVAAQQGRGRRERVAVALGGGGHRLAAGFTGYGEPEDVVDTVRRLLDEHLN